MRRLGAGVIFVLAGAGGASAQFASQVVAYEPAPGQFVQDPVFGDPANALGMPDPSGTAGGSAADAASLGGFGGRLTLAFASDVTDDPRNPMGLDAIVYGNAFWVFGDPTARWAEPATIEIASDANGNGIADDPWFLIPGSHLDAAPVLATTSWDDDLADPSHPPACASWIPAGRSGVWQTAAFGLPPVPFEQGPVLFNDAGDGTEPVFGYADCSPTAALDGADGVVLYGTPDDPMTVGIDVGSGGGDAFDIAWAIDPVTGSAAGLDAFRFVRFTSAVAVEGFCASAGDLGERSAEIDAVSDVHPAWSEDWDADGTVGVQDLLLYLGAWFTGAPDADLDASSSVTVSDLLLFLSYWFGARG